MDHNNILPVVLAGGKAKRFGGNKSQAQLRDKILIDYILSEILEQFNEVLIVANDPINHCLLYTSDAADDTPCVDLGGRRIIKNFDLKKWSI